MPAGAPYKYTPEQVQKKIDSYFEEIENKFFIRYDVVKTGEKAGQELPIKVKRMPSVQGLAVHIGITQREFYNWISDETQQKNPELFRITTHAKDLIESTQIEGAGAGMFQPVIVSRLNKLKDVSEVTTTSIDATGKTEEEVRAAIQAIEGARKSKD